jgi:hypothetical protein
MAENWADDAWSGRDFLDVVEGPIDRFRPIRVLFLVHRTSASGTLFVTGDWAFSIRSYNGQIVSAEGARGLMSALGIEAEETDLLSQLSAAIRAGISADRAIEAAGDALGDMLAHTSQWTDGLVRFESGGGRGQVSIPVSIPRVIAGGLRRVRPAEVVRRELGRHRHAPLRLQVPNDAPDSQWGLPPVAFRLVRDAVRVSSLGELLGAARGGETDEGWLAVDLAVQLGLLQIRTESVRGVAEVELSAEDRTLQAELRGVALHFVRASATEVLQITTSAQATDAGIDRAFRDASSRFHPDRFMRHHKAVQQAAAECFALVSDARSAIHDNPEARAELEARLRAKEEGRTFISAREKGSIEKARSAADFAIRKRDWQDAWTQASFVLALDPADCRSLYAAALAGWRLGKLSSTGAVERIRGLSWSNQREKAEALFQAGEILVSATPITPTQEAEALGLFHLSVAADPEHVGARRRIRLHEKRTAPPPEPPSTGGFSLKGLFSWRKNGGTDESATPPTEAQKDRSPAPAKANPAPAGPPKPAPKR